MAAMMEAASLIAAIAESLLEGVVFEVSVLSQTQMQTQTAPPLPPPSLRL